MASKSYVMRLLRIMRERKGRVLSLDEIGLLAIEERLTNYGHTLSATALENALKELAGLGVLSRIGDGWMLPGVDDGRGDGGKPPLPDDGFEDDGGAGGLAEVVAHPILFSRSPAEFEAALDAALGEQL